MPRKSAIYLSQSARLVQNMVAVISLRFEDEITTDSLIEDLNSTVSYPFDPDQVARNLQHLRRVGLISMNWHGRTLKREAALKEYVTKNVLAGEMWASIAEDWNRINQVITEKYGKANAEYQELLYSRQYARV